MSNYKSGQYFERKRIKKDNPNNFIFIDTESNSKQITNKIIELTFKIACIIFWNRQINEKIEKTYYDPLNFWIDVINRFDKNNKKIQHVYLLAHNTQFDFKMLNGWKILASLGWKINFRAIKNTIFILNYEKNNCIIHIWDTMNYVPQKLENIGKSVGLPKLKVDFDNVSDKELEFYCKRDTEIVFRFIKQFIEFLELYELTELKPTAGSCAKNCFLIKFYYPDKFDVNSRIGIHTWNQIIILERKAYKGGISDVFRYGEYNDSIKKLDINSQYPKVMKDMPLPIRCIGWMTESMYFQKDLFKFYNSNKKDYLFILSCTISLSEEFAYIINNFKDVSILNKNVFFSGISIIALCTPELEFIEKYGKILKIHSLAIYAKGYLFKEYTDFFYKMKVKFQNENNKIYREICKLFLNTFYGKWGQKQIITKEFSLKSNEKLYNKFILEVRVHLAIYCKKHCLKVEDLKTELIYICNFNGIEFWLNNGKYEYIKYTEINAKGSFVAIPAFITSYARMMLVDYILIAERENVYYCDTDSLVVNERGFENIKLKNLISITELGLLKVENELNEREKSAFWGPKFYLMDKDLKCKGVRKNAIIIEENKREMVTEMEFWQRFKTDFKKGISKIQIIETKEKRVSKIYTKGKINENNYIIPYSVSEIKALT